MSRDPLARMDVDTRWAYHRKVRKLQARHPERWPLYWVAYMALLGEAWATGNRRLTLEDAWCPAVPCSIDEATEALRDAEIIDRASRVPVDSWREWVEPALGRIARSSEAGSTAAHNRWHVGPSGKPSSSCGLCNDAMRSHSDRDAPRLPRHPHQPRPPRRARGAVDNSPNADDDAAARARARLNDPSTSDEIKQAARDQLRRLGEPVPA